MQQPNGPLFKFTLTIVKGRLQGDMTGERDGVVRAKPRSTPRKGSKDYSLLNPEIGSLVT